MKVKVWVETEAEADVSIGDMLACLDDLPDSDRHASVTSAINTAYGVLKRISDERIQEFDIAQRTIICNALREQADRYEVEKCQ